MDIVTPLTIKEALYHDSETGKAIGTEYWVISANGAEIACLDYEADARRIAACVNACKGIPTKLLEQGAGFWEKSNLHDQERDAAFANLLRVNARIFKVLKEADEYLSENKLNQIGHKSILHSKMIAAISEAEKTTAP